jgi:hypothetical protein
MNFGNDGHFVVVFLDVERRKCCMKDEVEREEKEESREFSGMLGSCWEVRVWGLHFT